jgi:uncharacterized protein (DUF1684 family)
MRPSLIGTLLAGVVSVGCSSKEAKVPAELADSAAFQRDHESKMRQDDLSPLTAVAAQYVEEGESLTVGVAADGPKLDAKSPTYEFSVKEGVFSCSLGCDEPAISKIRTLELAGTEGQRYLVVAAPQSKKGRVMLHDPNAEAREDFTGLKWFPLDASVRVTAKIRHVSPREPMEVGTSRGLKKTLWRAAVLEFSLAGTAMTLSAFGYAREPADGEEILIPFRDQTSGHESYGAGRYLFRSGPLSGDTLDLDFNRATNPLCAYSPHYNCSMPPRENHLPVRIAAGEKTYAEH